MFYVVRHSAPVRGVGVITSLFATRDQEGDAQSVINRVQADTLGHRTRAHFSIVEAPTLRNPWPTPNETLRRLRSTR